MIFLYNFVKSVWPWGWGSGREKIRVEWWKGYLLPDSISKDMKNKRQRSQGRNNSDWGQRISLMRPKSLCFYSSYFLFFSHIHSFHYPGSAPLRQHSFLGNPMLWPQCPMWCWTARPIKCSHSNELCFSILLILMKCYSYQKIFMYNQDILCPAHHIFCYKNTKSRIQWELPHCSQSCNSGKYKWCKKAVKKIQVQKN